MRVGRFKKPRLFPTKAELEAMKLARDNQSNPAKKGNPRLFPTRAQIEATRVVASFRSRPEAIQILGIQEKDIEEAANEDYLIDFFTTGVVMDARIDWEALSTRCRNALARTVDYVGMSELTKKSNFSLSEISSIQLGDLKDQLNVGITTLLNLICELQELSSLTKSLEKPREHAQSSEDFELENKGDDSLRRIRSDISNAESIASLQEAMLRYLSEIMDVQKRETDIWKVRLPWLTTTPETLASIGDQFGLTRERIRQITKKAERYPFLLDEPVRILQSVQNIILETDNYQDFIDELIDHEFVPDRNVGIGILRQLALALRQDEAASDLGRAIYEWSQSSPYWGMDSR